MTAEHLDKRVLCPEQRPQIPPAQHAINKGLAGVQWGMKHRVHGTLVRMLLGTPHKAPGVWDA